MDSLPSIAIAVILLIAGALFVAYIKSKNAEVGVLKNKNEALESAAKAKREQKRKNDEAEAKEVVASGDVERGIGFLRDSFRRPSEPR